MLLLAICSGFLILVIIICLIFHHIKKKQEVSSTEAIFIISFISVILMGLYSAIILPSNGFFITLFMVAGGITGFITSYIRLQEDDINNGFEVVKTVTLYIAIFFMSAIVIVPILFIIFILLGVTLGVIKFS